MLPAGRASPRRIRGSDRPDEAWESGEPRLGVETAVQEDTKPFQIEYDPGHPDANEEGYVLKPNVNVIEEMTEMIKAMRAYQANAAAFEAAKEMFSVSLQI